MTAVSEVNELPSESNLKNPPCAEEEKTAYEATTAQNDEDDPQSPKGSALALILTSLLMAMFLVSMDRNIIATAVPHITDDFHSLGDIAWYGSAYMLANSSSQLIFRRIYKLHSAKWVFLLVIGIFEIGSALSGGAPNSTALIIGRAISGVGSSGIFFRAMMILLHTIPLHRRPLYSGFFAAVFGILAVVGPLLGGAFTVRNLRESSTSREDSMLKFM